METATVTHRGITCARHQVSEERYRFQMDMQSIIKPSSSQLVQKYVLENSHKTKSNARGTSLIDVHYVTNNGNCKFIASNHYFNQDFFIRKYKQCQCKILGIKMF